MNDLIGFKVTIEFDCLNMIDEKSFKDNFNNDPLEAYRYISDDFKDSVLNYSNSEKIIKVSVLTKK